MPTIAVMENKWIVFKNLIEEDDILSYANGVSQMENFITKLRSYGSF